MHAGRPPTTWCLHSFSDVETQPFHVPRAQQNNPQLLHVLPDSSAETAPGHCPHMQTGVPPVQRIHCHWDNLVTSWITWKMGSRAVHRVTCSPTSFYKFSALLLPPPIHTLSRISLKISVLSYFPFHFFEEATYTLLHYYKY